MPTRRSARPRKERAMREEMVKLTHDTGAESTFRMASHARQARNAIREERYSSFGDIGTA